jgi:glycosidase
MKLNQVKGDHLDFVRKGAIYQIFPDRFAREASVAEGPEVLAGRELVAWNAAPTPQNFFGGNLRGVQSRLDYLDELCVGNIYFNPIFDAPSNHRYDTKNYFEIEPLIGTSDDLKSLTSAAKGHGIGVILDGVFNHSGREMAEFLAAKAGDPAWRDFFTIYPDGSYQTFGGTEFMPKLNTANPAVAEYFAKVIRHWHEYGVAAWRLDVPYKFADGFMRALREKTRDLSSAQYFIAEAWNEWSFATDFEAVQNYRTGNRILDFVHKHAADSEDFILDISRWCAGWSDFSVLPHFIDSHDTQRFATACEGRSDSWQLGFALHMLVPGVPVLFAGTELALEGVNDPGCRVTYPATLSDAQRRALDFSKPFVQLRGSSKALSHGGLEVHELKNYAIIFERRFNNEAIEVLVNAGHNDELLLANIAGEWIDMNQRPVTLTDTVPKRSLFYRKSA